MENSSGNSHGADTPKKSRSLDLKSLYESEISKESHSKKLKRKASAEDGVIGKEKPSKKKRNRKAVSLSSLKNVDSNGSKSVAEVDNAGPSLGLHDDSKDVKPDVGQRLNCNNGANSIFLRLDDNGVQIPRRKRDFVGRSKFESSLGSKLVGQPSSSKADHTDQVGEKSVGDVGGNSSKIKKKECDDFKENENSKLDLNKEDGNASHTFVKTGESSKKSGKDRKKKKGLACDTSHTANEPKIESPVRRSGELREDEEENLEENAARMLSSRFETSCTGLSSSSNGSASAPTDGLSFFFNGSHFVARGTKRFPGSDPVSEDSADRVLRPRMQSREKEGNSRQRRHYYEISSKDFDISCVLNKKIKVFWPLDQSWYYGLVNDYDEEKKLHHVKYDDRDEEWINLQNERFKLLLLPSEAPDSAGRRRSRNQKRDKQSKEGNGNLKPGELKEERDLTMQDDSSLASHLDSEPIISWLGRFNNSRFKSSSSGKKNKTCNLSPMSALLYSDEDYLDTDFAVKGKRKCSADSALPLGRCEESPLNSSASTSGSKHPIVYVRKRFCKSQASSSDIYKADNALTCEPDLPFSSLCPFERFVSMEKHEVSLEKLNPVAVLWSIDTTGFLKLTAPLPGSRQYFFNVNLPPLSFLKFLFRADNYALFQVASRNQFGVLTTAWPRVQLEMLFLDNIAGLRFLLFEGSLKLAVALVIVVLAVFHQPSEPHKYADQQLPVTSIQFKFSCTGLKKQLVFALYNFAELESLKWRYLESKLERHCSFARQLPLTACTYENISALQSGTDKLRGSSTLGFLMSKGSKRSRQGLVRMGVSRESTGVKVRPLVPYSDKMNLKLPPFALPFTAASAFFISLHLKMLMGLDVAQISFGDHDEIAESENSGSLIVDDSSSMEDCSNKVSVGTRQRNSKAPKEDSVRTGSELETVGPSVSSDGSSIKSSQKLQNGNLKAAGASACSHEVDEIGSETIASLKSKASSASPAPSNGISVEIPSLDLFEKQHDERESNGVQQSADLCRNMNGGVIPSPNPTGRRSTSHRTRGSSSLSLGHGWSDGKADSFQNNFGNGPKKPRTLVSYTLPTGGVDYSSKNKGTHPKGLVPRRIRGAHEKKPSDVSRGPQRNLELLSCEGNVLITLGDRGWRESGVQIVLELFDHNEWRIAVKISGVTRYSYKAHQFLQPGSTNRFTHAMMWKGGKDWILEFPDRSQWGLFKEMHEECHNRNIRAASVKNIPIPGVWLVEDNDDTGTELTFVRSSLNYVQQVETDVEMALDPFRILYDMDSDDEKWISETCNSSDFDNSSSHGISEELFEKTMDMFEKTAYEQQRDQFTYDEIEQTMAGFGSMEVIKAIYDYWRQKRQKKGMPLIRHLQPPSWERYQQQVKEWEVAMSKTPIGFQAASLEKPPMSAFCLKPRGLEVPNKGSKQRSHRKSSFSGKSYAVLDHDGFYTPGRRSSNAFAYGSERWFYSGNGYDHFDDSSASPRDIGHFSDGRPMHDRRNGMKRWDVDGFQKDWSETLDGPDLELFRVREKRKDAKHSIKMAKLKRQKAQKLLCRADLAIHKALSVILTAEAVKVSSEKSNGGDG
ncbi:uncharacterized protein [Rutidosis leptorrhynchoides]|uniref:uncharacterized protein n=1 Tax=Rutidosis leptorrhynchoides TaxID=125765 RepID=UPI003A9A1020